MSCERSAGGPCIVTGAGRNIGRGIAERLAAEGARVAMVDVDAERGADATAQINEQGYPGEAKSYRTDVTDESAVEALVADVTTDGAAFTGWSTTSPTRPTRACSTSRRNNRTASSPSV